MSSLIHKLKTTYPDLIFIEAEHFSWSPSEKKIFYDPKKAHASHLLLHELSHALLDHHEYRRDVELIAMETAAWEKAKTYADTYNVRFDENVIQDHLDTYRDWLHARSSCPNCSANGYQVEAALYTCPACSHRWKVNEARLCGLKRYSLSPTK
jgi:hypothetical protein